MRDEQQTTQQKLAEALRLALPFLTAMHADNTDEIVRQGAAALAEHDCGLTGIKVAVQVQKGTVADVMANVHIACEVIDYDHINADEDEVDDAATQWAAATVGMASCY